jgi:hypothetical protein
MAARLLLLLVIMLVFAVLYGCAQASSPAERQEHRAATQEAAKDRQPMKRERNLPRPRSLRTRRKNRTTMYGGRRRVSWRALETPR